MRSTNITTFYSTISNILQFLIRKNKYIFKYVIILFTYYDIVTFYIYNSYAVNKPVPKISLGLLVIGSGALNGKMLLVCKDY